MDTNASVVMLDESNYTTWRSQIMNFLVGRGLKDARFNPSHDSIEIRQSAEAAAMIMGTVSPPLLLRVPREDLLIASRLLAHLENFAQPFRFLDLSAEVRNLVYEYYLEANDRELKEHYLDPGAFGKMIGSRMPDLSQVCKQLRNEFRSVYFAECQFFFDFREQSSLEDVEDTIEKLLEWTQCVAGPEVRHMRRLNVSFEDQRWLKLSLDERDGLKLEGDGSGSEEEATMKHLRQTDAVRKALRLKGEALMMFLTQNPSIWPIEE